MATGNIVVVTTGADAMRDIGPDSLDSRPLFGTSHGGQNSRESR